jgi:hypothetical protein
LAKPKLILHSNFRKAREAGQDATQELIEKATDRMQETASKRLEAGASRRGYALPRTIEKDIGRMEGKIRYPHFFGRFFEYGTAHIGAVSFMRPGHRAGRKVVRNDAPDIFDGWMRKARVR